MLDQLEQLEECVPARYYASGHLVDLDVTRIYTYEPESGTYIKEDSKGGK